MIDRINNVTVGAGMVHYVFSDEKPSYRIYSEAEKELNAYVRKYFPEWGCEKIK